jgi:hypothetical protein
MLAVRAWPRITILPGHGRCRHCLLAEDELALSLLESLLQVLPGQDTGATTGIGRTASAILCGCLWCQTFRAVWPGLRLVP